MLLTIKGGQLQADAVINSGVLWNIAVDVLAEHMWAYQFFKIRGYSFI